MDVTEGGLSYTMTLDNRQFEDAIKSAIGDVNIMQNAVTGLAQGLITLASAEGMKQFATKAFEMRSFFQDAESAMKVFLKSDEKAAAHLKELQSYAWYNVFDFTELVTASRQLQAFGTDVEDVIPVIDRLSNIAAATKTPLQNLVEIYNKAKSIGRLDSRGVMSLGSMGINVKETLKEMGEQAEVSSISFEKLQKVINHLTDEGGMFAGLMDEQFNNLSSLKGAVEDAIDTMFANFGEDLQPMFESLLKGAQEFIKWIDDHRENIERLAKTIITLVGAYGIYKGALALNILYTNMAAKGAALLNLSVDQLGGKAKFAAARLGMLTTATKAMNTALSAGVWTAVIASVIKLGVELNKFAKAQHAVSDAAVTASQDATSAVEQEKMEFNSLVDTLEKTKVGSDKYGEALEELKKKYPDLINSMIQENGLLEDTNRLRAEGNRLLGDQILKLSTAAKKQSAFDSAQGAFMESQKELISLLRGSGLSSIDAEIYANKLLEAAQNVKYEKNTLYRSGSVDGFLGLTTYMGSARVATDDTGWSDVQRIISEALSKGTSKKNQYSIAHELMAFGNQFGQAMEIIETASEYEEMMLKQLGEGADNETKENLSKASDASKQIKELEKERKKLQEKYKKDGLSDEEQKRLESILEDLDNLKKEYKKLSGVDYDTMKKSADAASKSARDLKKTIAEMSQHEYDLSLDLEQKRLENLENGFSKEQQMREINHTRNVNEIMKWGKEELKKYEELDKKKWVDANQEAIKKGTLSEEDFYRQYVGVSEEDRKKVNDAEARMLEEEQTRFEKENVEALKKLLDNYGDYTEKKKDIDRKYNEERKALEKAAAEASSDEEKKRYENAIKEAGKAAAKSTFELDIDKINSSYYKNVEDRMEAVNKAYEDYIDALDKAGASTEELEAVEAERVETAGNLATINAKIEDFELKKKIALDKGDIDRVKELNEEIAKLQDELDKMGNDSEKKGLKQMFKDWAKDIKGSDVAGLVSDIGSAISEIGDAAGSTAMKDAGEAVTGLGNAIGSVAQGFSQGGWIGAAVAAVQVVANEVVNAMAAAERLDRAIADANFDKWIQDQQKLLEEGKSIFGSDSVAMANASVQVIRNTTDEIAKLTDEALKAQESFYMTANGIRQLGTMQGALAKGYKDAEAIVVRTSKGWYNTYNNLRDAAAELGYELYGKDGVLNKNALQAVVDGYEDLDSESKVWIEKMISGLETYEDAWGNLAEYLSDLFGGVVDDIVDQVFDGMVDIEQISSDTGKKIAKDLMKSLILGEYFSNLEDDAKDIIGKYGGFTDEAANEIFAKFSAAMGNFNRDLPRWEAMAANLSEAYGFDTEAASIAPGTSLASASQESIDMMNGQLNAMRAVQGRMENAVNGILLELRGFRNDVNSGMAEQTAELKDINRNTSTGNSLLRSLGAYT